VSDRLHQLEARLNELQEQLSGMEEALVLSPMEEQTRLKLRIKKLRADMRPFEIEKWQILASHSGDLALTEPEAEVIVGEIVTQVNQLAALPSADGMATIMPILLEIRDKLDQSTLSSPEKVKGVLSSFPPFVGVFYEADLDSSVSFPKDFGRFCHQYFPTFSGGVEKLAQVIRNEPKK